MSMIDIYEDDSDNETINTETSISNDYLSDDEIPDYVPKANNLVPMTRKKSVPMQPAYSI